MYAKLVRKGGRMSDVKGPCWPWIMAKDHLGYGVWRKGGWSESRMAHRRMYELIVGRIPEGLTLDHLCRNRSCVNPDHLEPVELRENILRGDNPCAQNARKTHCPRGHPLAGRNLVIDQGRRRCRECLNKAKREHMRRKRQRLASLREVKPPEGDK